MNLAVIGSGGREHAICYKLKQSPKIKKLICLPGNAGIEEIAENVDVDISNFDLIYKILKKYKIDNLNFSFNIKTNEYIIKDVGANFNKLSLSLPLIDIREENNSFSIKGNLVSENNNIDLKEYFFLKLHKLQNCPLLLFQNYLD